MQYYCVFAAFLLICLATALDITRISVEKSDGIYFLFYFNVTIRVHI